MVWNIVRDVVSKGGWVRHVHVEDFVPAYNAFLSAQTTTTFDTYADGLAAVKTSLIAHGFFDLFGIPDSAEIYFWDDDNFESDDELPEYMLDALIKYGVFTLLAA